MERQQAVGDVNVLKYTESLIGFVFVCFFVVVVFLCDRISSGSLVYKNISETNTLRFIHVVVLLVVLPELNSQNENKRFGF